MQAQIQNGKLTSEGPPEGGPHTLSGPWAPVDARSASTTGVMLERNPTTAGRTMSAQSTLKSTPTRMLPSRPNRGSRTQVDTRAPVAAPSVFTPYKIDRNSVV